MAENLNAQNYSFDEYNYWSKFHKRQTDHHENMPV